MAGAGHAPTFDPTGKDPAIPIDAISVLPSLRGKRFETKEREEEGEKKKYLGRFGRHPLAEERTPDRPGVWLAADHQLLEILIKEKSGKKKKGKPFRGQRPLKNRAAGSGSSDR